MNPRIQKLRQRYATPGFSLMGPKARYLAAALILEGSLVAMSLLVPGTGRIQARALSQGLQIETAEQVAVEAIQDEPAEPTQDPLMDDLEVSTSIELTRFHILDQDPLPLDLPMPDKEPVEVDPESAPETWLHRVTKKKQETRKVKETASATSAAQVRLVPLEGQSPKPRYPAAAVRLGLEGSILFKMHVGAQGTVLKLEVIEQDCPHILTKAATQALLLWRFQGGPGVFEKRIVFSLVDRD